MPQLVGRGHRAGGKGGELLEGRGQGGKGKGKGAIVSETCGHLGGQAENGESPAVQSGRALPKGRCASPPCIYGVFIGINNEPCITLPSSLHILNTLGFIFVLLLFPHKTNHFKDR